MREEKKEKEVCCEKGYLYEKRGTNARVFGIIFFLPHHDAQISRANRKEKRARMMTTHICV